MRHGRRSVLTTEDVNSALRLRNVEVRGRWQRRGARVDFLSLARGCHHAPHVRTIHAAAVASRGV